VKLKEYWRESKRMEWSFLKKIYIIIYIKLRDFKLSLMRFFYGIKKYKHKHFYNTLFRCLICGKTKIDIDYEIYGVDKNDN